MFLYNIKKQRRWNLWLSDSRRQDLLFTLVIAGTWHCPLWLHLNGDITCLIWHFTECLQHRCRPCHNVCIIMILCNEVTLVWWQSTVYWGTYVTSVMLYINMFTFVLWQFRYDYILYRSRILRGSICNKMTLCDMITFVHVSKHRQDYICTCTCSITSTISHLYM